jgi:hypothetical protein
VVLVPISLSIVVVAVVMAVAAVVIVVAVAAVKSVVVMVKWNVLNLPMHGLVAPIITMVAVTKTVRWGIS